MFLAEGATSQIAQDANAAFLQSAGVTFIVENTHTTYIPTKGTFGASSGGGGGY